MVCCQNVTFSNFILYKNIFCFLAKSKWKKELIFDERLAVIAEDFVKQNVTTVFLQSQKRIESIYQFKVKLKRF